jgi:hypothetical protein
VRFTSANAVTKFSHPGLEGLLIFQEKKEIAVVNTLLEIHFHSPKIS